MQATPIFDDLYAETDDDLTRRLVLDAFEYSEEREASYLAACEWLDEQADLADREREAEEQAQQESDFWDAMPVDVMEAATEQTAASVQKMKDSISQAWENWGETHEVPLEDDGFEEQFRE